MNIRLLIINSSGIRKMASLKPLSDLVFLEVKDATNPWPLFNEWLDEASKFTTHSTRWMNLATSTKKGQVSARTVVLRDVTKDGALVFTTKTGGEKVKNIIENPRVAATFLWMYPKDNKNITRQVRVEGIAQQLPKEECRMYFDQEPVFCKIRTIVCPQGSKVDWKQLKEKHDALLKEVVENNKQLEMPDNTAAYKITPNKMDFNLSWDTSIADRVIFIRSSDGWKYERVGA